MFTDQAWAAEAAAAASAATVGQGTLLRRVALVAKWGLNCCKERGDQHSLPCSEAKRGSAALRKRAAGGRVSAATAPSPSESREGREDESSRRNRRRRRRGRREGGGGRREGARAGLGLRGLLASSRFPPKQPWGKDWKPPLPAMDWDWDTYCRWSYCPPWLS